MSEWMKAFMTGFWTGGFVAIAAFLVLVFNGPK